MHKLLAHPLFEERDPKEVLEPFGFDVHLHFEDPPCPQEEPEAWAIFETQTKAYLDNITYTPTYGFAEMGRFVNEDGDITIISVRPKSDFAMALLWSDVRFEDDQIDAPIEVLFELSNERNRQIHGEGFTLDQDDQWTKGELASLACSYAHHAAIVAHDIVGANEPTWMPSNMDSKWWKPSLDPRRNLIKSGALILAEIERLDRDAAKAAAHLQSLHAQAMAEGGES
ncbi:hypothetical protein [Vreelandella sp.]|uniref:hypothetical protein n=1 Tax=Vreelandella sp. TaxID=3137778 RepID=UPI003BAB68AE